ncbi:hypothetical protein E2C01_003168 [Portunus trituberculatus]|uniref:Uncharacterized protein n=1 Tax=Portunus trituberculatus TaxID=210409 RepID=A0A5B7CP14_PORTR|nr:hypothetical protein [Portunus trituberculatus]
MQRLTNTAPQPLGASAQVVPATTPPDTPVFSQTQTYMQVSLHSDILRVRVRWKRCGRKRGTCAPCMPLGDQRVVGEVWEKEG